MTCQRCGADNPPEAVICNYCGSHLPSSEERDRAAIFARIKASDQYATSGTPERHARLPKYHAFHKIFLYVFFAMFIGGAAFMLLISLGMAFGIGLFGMQLGDGPGAAFGLVPLLFAIFPLAFVLLGILMFTKIQKKMRTIEEAPVEPLPVVVVDKRTHVSGGSGDSSASTHYFATCESEDGSRQEYQLWGGDLYGRMAPDDAGILYTRSGYGLDFDRVPV